MGSGAAWAMTTAIDTNVIGALWDRDPSLSSAAQSALDAALERGTLVTTASVYAELMAAPGRSESFLDSLFITSRDTRLESRKVAIQRFRRSIDDLMVIGSSVLQNPWCSANKEIPDVGRSSAGGNQVSEPAPSSSEIFLSHR